MSTRWPTFWPARPMSWSRRATREWPAPIEVTDDDRAHEVEADLFVIGPEAPLVDGLADALRAQGQAVWDRARTARCSRAPRPS